MSAYQVKVNRTTAHIDGFAEKTTGNGSHDSYWAENVCGSLTRGNLANTGKPVATAAEALKEARLSRSKVCKNCERAALAQIALDEAAAAAETEAVTETPAPIAYAPFTAEVLPVGVTMAAGRTLSGPVKSLLDMHRRGIATLTEDGDLVLK